MPLIATDGLGRLVQKQASLLFAGELELLLASSIVHSKCKHGPLM